MTSIAFAPEVAHDRKVLRERARLVRELRKDGIVFACRQVPIEPENGDFVAVAKVEEHRWIVAIGDVMGHGHDAAELAREVCDHIEERAHYAQSLGDLVSTANELVCERTDGEKFVSLLLLVIDGRTGTFRIANAGSEEPLAVGRGGGVVALEGHGPALGVLRDYTFRESGPIRMARGMIMLATTDGVIDALDAEGKRYGRHRASMALAEARHNGPKAVVRRILREAQDHACHQDDRTVLAVQFV